MGSLCKYLRSITIVKLTLNKEVAANLSRFRDLYKNDTRFKIAYIDSYQSDGVGWARHISLNYYTNEKYILMVDSHTRFAVGWDEQLIEEFNKALKFSDKPILSCYPADTDGFSPLRPNDPVGRQQEMDVDWPGVVTFRTVLYPTLYYKDPQPWYFMAAGYVFTWGKWVLEVPTDPNVYFAGEECLYSVRLVTRFLIF